MLNRRMLLGAGALLASPLAVPSLARAQSASWAKAYPELVFAIIPAENASGVIDRWTPFTEYMSKKLGTKVTLRIANDYAAVIEGQRSGKLPPGNRMPWRADSGLTDGAQYNVRLFSLGSSCV